MGSYSAHAWAARPTSAPTSRSITPPGWGARAFRMACHGRGSATSGNCVWLSPGPAATLWAAPCSASGHAGSLPEGGGRHPRPALWATPGHRLSTYWGDPVCLGTLCGNRPNALVAQVRALRQGERHDKCLSRTMPIANTLVLSPSVMLKLRRVDYIVRPNGAVE